MAQAAGAGEPLLLPVAVPGIDSVRPFEGEFHGFNVCSATVLLLPDSRLLESWNPNLHPSRLVLIGVCPSFERWRMELLYAVRLGLPSSRVVGHNVLLDTCGSRVWLGPLLFAECGLPTLEASSIMLPYCKTVSVVLR